MLALIGIVCLALQGTRIETWPDGAKKTEYAFGFDEHGNAEKNGPFRSFFADGTLESQGTFVHGKENGAWTFFHPNGARAAAGSFAEGLRSGAWESFFADDKLESKGAYVRGARDGRWTFWKPDGTKDLVASGIQRLEVYHSKEDGRHYRGYFVDNRRQGPWTSHWPDKSVQLEGSFTSGERDGEWLFRHPDGVPSALLFTGRYAQGHWEGASAVPEPPCFDPARFPPPEPSPLGWPARHEELRSALEEARAQRTLAPELAASLATIGVPAIPLALEVLRTTDPETPTGRADLGFLESAVLRPLCAGHALSRYGETGPPDAPAARELVRAWLSLWTLTRADLVFWKEIVPGPSRAAGLRDVLQDPPIFELDRRYAPPSTTGESAPVATAPAAAPAATTTSGEPAPALRAAYRFRFGRAKEERLRYAPAGTKESLAHALHWLAAHQESDGHWSIAHFAQRCAKEREPCNGPGKEGHDVGATALAVLALLGDGQTMLVGAYHDNVTRALAWLAQQQTSEGLIGKREVHDFLYGHAMATAALCEAFGLGDAAARAPAERALLFLQFARNPESGWRYDVPPTGECDTSVTGWAVEALLAARHAGLAIDDAALTGALNWIDRMRDPTTGRIGYSDRGELSSRDSTNQDFPRHIGEAMTGVGLACRLRLGRTPNQDATLLAQAKLIAAKPPTIDAQWGADQYYWFTGTWALYEYGAPFWDAWELELRKTVILSQSRREDADGSWDPSGPWGGSMGRVCTTALLALTLECFVRYPRALEGK